MKGSTFHFMKGERLYSLRRDYSAVTSKAKERDKGEIPASIHHSERAFFHIHPSVKRRPMQDIGETKRRNLFFHGLWHRVWEYRRRSGWRIPHLSAYKEIHFVFGLSSSSSISQTATVRLSTTRNRALLFPHFIPWSF